MDNKKKEVKDEHELIRLNKFLSDAGVCSRREGDRLIEAGKVVVNGKVALMGQKVTINDDIVVNGQRVSREDERILIALNKPVGIECTTDLNNKDNIVDFVNYPKRIYPVGRLDKNSQGLILMTNDGSLVNSILKASNGHKKEYHVWTDKQITDEFVEKMSSGVEILDTVTRPCKVVRLKKNMFSIVLTQGLNRQIRRMCEALGYRVVKLKRIRIMNIELGNLPIGSYRDVTKEEFETMAESFRKIKIINNFEKVNKMAQLDRIKELVELLNEASKAYYQESREIMPNIEYDRLYDELVELEKETGIVLANSPTVNVGYEVISELQKKHMKVLCYLLIRQRM